MRILLLENVHQTAKEQLQQLGSVTCASTLNEVRKQIHEYDIIGIRSTTNLSSDLLSGMSNLKAIGCFCIGTDQVDLTFAASRGIAVFNSPHSSGRSVAELIIGQLITLARQSSERNLELHRGFWNKTSRNCHEVRGKTLGIVGYGNIGGQLSVLAEALGMRVLYYDIVKKTSLGNAKPVSCLDELLSISDFLTLHVPDTESTRNMIGDRELLAMKKGSYLLNASRGRVLDLSALERNIAKLSGVYLDVYPEEPAVNGNLTADSWPMRLSKYTNIVLSPHIGGSTEEAQEAIALDVSEKLLKYMQCGDTSLAVNFPNVSVSTQYQYRMAHIHHNLPGVIRDVTSVLLSQRYNILRQVLSTNENIGYVVIDVDQPLTHEILEKLKGWPYHILTRIL